MDLLSHVRRYIDRLQLVPPGARVLVALSGGADSVAMVFVLRELQTAGVLTLAGVAHLNHQLRGAQADADEAFCAALAGRLALPFRSERIDVAALARLRRRSLEDAARTARYGFLSGAAVALAADVIAVAHTRDDQAETFLLRLVRGAGARGLGGIRPRVGNVVRPLLDVPRENLRAYLRALDETFREDGSNADLTVPRNRIRHELLPYLRQHFSARVTDVLAREAASAQQDEQYLEAGARELAASMVSGPETGSLVLNAAALTAAPSALATRIARAALERGAGDRPVSYDHICGLLRLAAQAADGSLSLPGQVAVRTGLSLTLQSSLAPRIPSLGGSDVNSFAVSLSIPGEVHLAPQRLAVGAEKLAGSAARLRTWGARDTEVGVAPEAVQLPLAVRSRRPGDRFRPLGAPGVRKLQDFLVDRKVPRFERDTLPLVVDANDRIVWVVGQSVAEDFRVTDPSRGVLLLKVRRLGGPG